MQATGMGSDKGVLKQTALYFGDNGRCFCGKLRCAGASAFYTGRDLSGQLLERVTPRVLAECRADNFEPKCEGCSMRAEGGAA